MNFADAVRVCLRKYAQFSGRASRPEYWWFVLFLVGAGIALSVLEGVVFGFDVDPTDLSKSPLSTLFALATFIPSISAAVRRLHDMGRSGWALFLPVIPLAAAGVVLLILLVYQATYLHAGGSTPVSTLLLTVVVILGLATFVAFILTIWWTTRPTVPGPNAYGPMPGSNG